MKNHFATSPHEQSLTSTDENRLSIKQFQFGRGDLQVSINFGDQR